MKRILCGMLFLPTLFAAAQTYKSLPMWNYKLSVEQRVNDVVSRLTLEEKVAQMLNGAPAVPRLGIPAYDWWNEVLHGVARTSYKVTVFPQAIAMAATWDTASLFRMADYSALEGRAIHNKAMAAGKTNEKYVGLTYWTPNINIFRDPRWGRGQETYGEDPYLTARLASSFVRGLQGNDPTYLKAAACAKHFAVHSGPEPSRHSDNFNPTTYDLWDTYLPAFRQLIVNDKVAGVMCAYNAVNTQPCCANDFLMNDLLRRQWNFKGYVTSDCWAIDDFFNYHKTHKNATTAAVDAVMHGTDVECGVAVYKTLVDAVKSGLITEQQIDISVKRLFTIRFQLGMFDPVSLVKYAQTPATVLESAPHQAHALKMAQQSIVLLRNENNTLPLSKNIKRMAVVGPNADNAIAVLGNYNGIPSKIVTVLDGIKAKLGSGVEVIYERGVTFTSDSLMMYSDQLDRFSWNGKPGFKAEYYNNRNLQGDPVMSKTEKQIDFSWQRGDDLGGGLQANNFSARYSSFYSAKENKTVLFEVEANDGYRLKINDKEVLNAWDRNRMGAVSYELKTETDSVYKIELEYWQGDEEAFVTLRTGNLGRSNFNELTQRLSGVDAIVFAGGISPQLEGEQMKVNAPGFVGGDRSSILLPAVQTELLKALKATGKPVVFVMMTGSALATPWESENIPAIVNAWYGGQSAGTAIADVLFGDYNPAGRLPVTFYKSEKDLPGFSDYSMEGRTYRYFKGDVLYPFGYGLSYSSFRYSGLSVSPLAKGQKTLKATVTITNTSKRDGEEVVQLYVAHEGVETRKPIRALKGFKRLTLKAGEIKQVSFTLKQEDWMLVSESDGKFYLPKGNLEISMGGGQPHMQLATSGNVLSKTIHLQ